MSDTFPTLFFDPLTIEHRPGAGHPERPGRLEAIRDQIRQQWPDASLQSAPPATRKQLERIHTADYIDRVFDLRDQTGQLDPDTRLSPDSVDAALLAAGMATAAVESTIADGRPSFALVRPPGHHAERNRGMGFCIFSNVAVATASALAGDDVGRALIVDWDVHHGNGTQQAFWDRGDTLFFSTHQYPFYPGTGDVDEIGTGDGEGTTVNVPLPAGAGDGALYEAFDTILAPAARKFDPDLVVVSAGFDAHALDPVGGMQATTDGFAALTAFCDRLAGDLADGRLALILEGGYHLDALARSVEACIKTLASPDLADLDPPATSADPSSADYLERVRRHHG